MHAMMAQGRTCRLYSSVQGSRLMGTSTSEKVGAEGPLVAHKQVAARPTFDYFAPEHSRASEFIQCRITDGSSSLGGVKSWAEAS